MNGKPEEVPTPGDKKWSPYFNDNVVLVGYVSDDHWTFKLEQSPAKGVARAQTKWSRLGPPKP